MIYVTAVILKWVIRPIDQSLRLPKLLIQLHSLQISLMTMMTRTSSSKQLAVDFFERINIIWKRQKSSENINSKMKTLYRICPNSERRIGIWSITSLYLMCNCIQFHLLLLFCFVFLLLVSRCFHQNIKHKITKK